MNIDDPSDQPLEPLPATPDHLLADLAHFTGTEAYHRYLGGLYLTQGVKYLADHAQCYWLLDAIASYQPQLAGHADWRLQNLQFWTLKVGADKSALLTCVADSGEQPAVSQPIEFTDFPLPEIQIWVGGAAGAKVAYLPTEH